MAHVNWQRVRDILISIICIGILLWATWSILGQFLHAVVLLLLSMAVAFLLTPMVNYLARYRYMPRVVAALIVYVIVLAALAGFGYALIFSLVNQVQAFSNTVLNYVTIDLPKLPVELQAFLRGQGISQASIDEAVNQAVAQIQQQATTFAQSLVTNAVAIVLGVTDAFVNILLVAVLSFYLTLDGKRIRDNLFSIVPKRSQSFFLLFEDALKSGGRQLHSRATYTRPDYWCPGWSGMCFLRIERICADHWGVGLHLRDHPDGWACTGFHSCHPYFTSAP